MSEKRKRVLKKPFFYNLLLNYMLRPTHFPYFCFCFLHNFFTIFSLLSGRTCFRCYPSSLLYSSHSLYVAKSSRHFYHPPIFFPLSGLKPVYQKYTEREPARFHLLLSGTNLSSVLPKFPVK